MGFPKGSFLLHCRLVHARLGWPGLAGVLLVVAWLPLQFLWLPAQDHQLQRLAERSRELRQELARLSDSRHQAATPQQQLETLLTRFPPRSATPLQLARLRQLAEEAGIGFARAEYPRERDAGGNFATLTVVLPVKATYPRLRDFLDALRTQMPTVAVEDIQLKRDAIATPELEVRLRLKLYQRREM